MIDNVMVMLRGGCACRVEEGIVCATWIGGFGVGDEEDEERERERETKGVGDDVYKSMNHRVHCLINWRMMESRVRVQFRDRIVQ